jgi:hypothetical protein
LVFAAGKTKVIGAGARIGVHHATGGASLRAADETAAGNEGTNEVASVLEKYGAPLSVVAAARRTPSNQIYWLTPDDLVAWKVEEGGSALVFPPPPK